MSIKINNSNSPDTGRSAENYNCTNNIEEGCIENHTFKSRLHYFFKKLVHVISNPKRHIHFILDNLQWANSASLDLASNWSSAIFSYS